MKLVAVVAQKGGAGKSTVSANLAVAAHLAGHRVMVTDCDPQESLVDWGKARGGRAPHVAPVKMRNLGPTRNAIEKVGMDRVIIDTRASSPDDSITAANAAHMTLIVVRPTVLDLRAIARTVEDLKPLGRPTAFVLNQAPSQRVGKEPVIVGEAIELLVGYGLAVAPVGLRSRVVYQTAFGRGLGVQEAEPRGPASDEVATLWAYVESRLAKL